MKNKIANMIARMMIQWRVKRIQKALKMLDNTGRGWNGITRPDRRRMARTISKAIMKTGTV